MLYAGPASGMFEMFGRTGLQTLLTVGIAICRHLESFLGEGGGGGARLTASLSNELIMYC